MSRPTIPLPSRKEMLAAELPFETKAGLGIIYRFASAETCARFEAGQWQLGREDWRKGAFVEPYP